MHACRSEWLIVKTLVPPVVPFCSSHPQTLLLIWDKSTTSGNHGHQDHSWCTMHDAWAEWRQSVAPAQPRGAGALRFLRHGWNDICSLASSVYSCFACCNSRLSVTPSWSSSSRTHASRGHTERHYIFACDIHICMATYLSACQRSYSSVIWRSPLGNERGGRYHCQDQHCQRRKIHRDPQVHRPAWATRVVPYMYVKADMQWCIYVCMLSLHRSMTCKRPQ